MTYTKDLLINGGIMPIFRCHITSGSIVIKSTVAEGYIKRPNETEGERTSDTETCIEEGGILVNQKDDFHSAQLGSPQ